MLLLRMLDVIYPTSCLTKTINSNPKGRGSIAALANHPQDGPLIKVEKTSVHALNRISLYLLATIADHKWKLLETTTGRSK